MIEYKKMLRNTKYTFPIIEYKKMPKNTKHNNPPHNHFKFIKLQQTWLNPTTLEERTENIQDQQTATTTTNEFRITTLEEEKSTGNVQAV